MALLRALYLLERMLISSDHAFLLPVWEYDGGKSIVIFDSVTIRSTQLLLPPITQGTVGMG